MSGISSKAAGGVENKKKFNGGSELENKEFSDGSGLEMYDCKNRMYDPQIGRFHQIDPLADFSVSWSTYTFSSDNPILRNDPSGLKDTVVNGEKGETKQLPNVTVREVRKTQSTLGYLWRTYAGHYSHISTQVCNLTELGANSLLRRDMVWLTGDLLTRVKNDAAMKRHQQLIIAYLRSDPRFKKLSFIYSNTGESVEFGGKRAAGEDWFSISKNNPLLNKATYDVAANPLTWTLRHAQVQTDAIVKEDGTIVLNHYVSDQLDLRPGPDHTPAYNRVTSVIGPVYHDVLRGNWSVTINP